MGVFDETIVVIKDEEPVAVGTFARRAHLVNEDGTAFSGGSGASDVPDGAVTSEKLAEGVIPEAYVLPAATAEALGGVKKAAAVADATDDAVGTLNALLASLRAAGMVEASA